MADDDSAWKEILDHYLEEFLQFFFPQAHRDIDWSRKPIFLDKELQAILRRVPRGRQYVDKLVKVRLRSGEKAWILIHVEIEMHEFGPSSEVWWDVAPAEVSSDDETRRLRVAYEEGRERQRYYG